MSSSACCELVASLTGGDRADGADR